MKPLTVGSLFAGIGGFDLGLERTGGFRVVWQCEIDEYCQRVLAKHWPHVKRYGDIRELHHVERVDVLCGGFPCQDISFAGTGSGLDGERSSLFFEMVRVLRLSRARILIVENSSALLVRGMGRVLAELAAAGFDAEWTVLRACDFGATHERERIYIVAYANESNGEARLGTQQDRQRAVFAEDHHQRLPIWLQAASRFAGMDDGVRGRAYQDRVGALGNAVVPQIVTWIGKQILDTEDRRQEQIP